MGVNVSHLELAATLVFTGVAALRVVRSHGPFGNAYLASIDWAQFDGTGLDISSSAMLLEDGELSFWVRGMKDDVWYELTIHAEKLEIEGVSSLQEFIRLGRAYWDNFGS